VRRLWILVVLGCGSTPPPPPPPLAHKATPAPLSAPVVDARCAGDLAFHRETLVRGRETEIAGMGERATFRGEQFDHGGDGTSAVILQLEVFGEPWLPDARDRGVHAFGDHCLRIIEASGDRIELDVALQPAHQYDSHRCKISCCVTSAQQKPAPDGSIECCFCADDPTP